MSFYIRVKNQYDMPNAIIKALSLGYKRKPNHNQNVDAFITDYTKFWLHYRQNFILELGASGFITYGESITHGYTEILIQNNLFNEDDFLL